MSDFATRRDSNGDFTVLAHSKGLWKKHKYVEKKGEGQNAVYKYIRDKVGLTAREELKEADKNYERAQKKQERAQSYYDYSNEKVNQSIIDMNTASTKIKTNSKKLIENNKKSEEKTLAGAAAKIQSRNNAKATSNGRKQYKMALDNNIRATNKRKQASEKLDIAKNNTENAGAKASQAATKYFNTPLGKLENAIATGKQFIDNLLKK